MFSETLAPLFQTFKQRKDTFSLGICNGCQLMTLIGWVGSFDESTVKQIVDVADVVLLQNKSERKQCATLHYVDDNVKRKEVYPMNPNGSAEGIAGFRSPVGPHLAMMPHPDRCYAIWNKPIKFLTGWNSPEEPGTLSQTIRAKTPADWTTRASLTKVQSPRSAITIFRFKDNDIEVKRKDGIILLRELSAEVKNFMDFKRNAVMLIIENVKAKPYRRHRSSETHDESLKTQQSSGDIYLPIHLEQSYLSV
ncbi:hypothetical protein GQX74_009517 [Glossina fuscipes]|nr:hypothetical protein GQX74_009517 [Glossina fuscipes]